MALPLAAARRRAANFEAELQVLCILVGPGEAELQELYVLVPTDAAELQDVGVHRATGGRSRGVSGIALYSELYKRFVQSIGPCPFRSGRDPPD